LEADQEVNWDSDCKTKHVLSLMDENNASKIANAVADGGRMHGTLFRRMRKDGAGKSVQRAEVRFDGLAGCLRVPRGGSSKLTVLQVDEGRIRTRLATPRECARLMGLDDRFLLPPMDNDAYRVTGDGVVVDKVRFLRDRLFNRLLNSLDQLSVEAHRKAVAL
ncbi:MAG: DNA cytosine methyltransferase, partial [Pseudomonadota bacterium]